MQNIVILSKWERARVVCTQNFGEPYPFGLTYLAFNYDDEKAEDDKPKEKTVNVN
jgi:hypothetical protein